MENPTKFTLRLATEEDISALDALIEASVRGLQASDYTQAQIEGALGTVLGLDSQLIRDGTYFLAEAVDGDHVRRLAGCGGWSKRRTLFGPIAGRDGSRSCWTRERMRLKCGRFLCIRSLRGGDWEH